MRAPGPRVAEVGAFSSRESLDSRFTKLQADRTQWSGALDLAAVGFLPIALAQAGAVMGRYRAGLPAPGPGAHRPRAGRPQLARRQHRRPDIAAFTALADTPTPSPLADLDELLARVLWACFTPRPAVRHKLKSPPRPARPPPTPLWWR